MIIEVRPTPALRRHRARIAGAVGCLAMLAVSAFSVAELASPTGSGAQQAPYSDPQR